MRKAFEALQAWRRAHAGAYPESLADLTAAGLSGPEGLGCPASSSDGRGGVSAHRLVSSRGDGLDPARSYEYELSTKVVDQFREGWPSKEPLRRRDYKLVLLRRPFHEQVPILRCSAHRSEAPDPEGGERFRNLTDSGNIYWSGPIWEQEWIQDVPVTVRQPTVLLGQPGPPFFTRRAPPDSAFVDLSGATNAYATFAWWWGLPMIHPARTAPHLGLFFSTGGGGGCPATVSGMDYWLDTVCQLQGRIRKKAKNLSDPVMVCFPWERRNIPVNRRTRSISWLQATVYEGKRDIPAAWFHWNYEDGTVSDPVPAVYGRDTMRFWSDAGQSVREADFPAPAWQKWETDPVDGAKRTLRVCRQIWINPHPEKKILSFDFISNRESPASPFLIAMSVEP